jgi:hypothetical protein
MSGVITRIKLLNMGGTAEFGWGPEDPVDERQLEVGGSGGHGIFRWEPLGVSVRQRVMPTCTNKWGPPNND